MRTQRVRTYSISHDVPQKVITDTQQLVSHCADLLTVSRKAILGDCRIIELVAIRHSIMWICRRKFKMTLSTIGRELDKDHSTVIHGVRSVDNWLEMPKHYNEQMTIYNHIVSNCIFTEGVSKHKSIQYIKTTMANLQAELNRLEAIGVENLLTISNKPITDLS